MSAIQINDFKFTCDTEGCFYQSYPTQHESEDEARLFLTNWGGWKRVNGRDLCPECASKEKGGEACAEKEAQNHGD